MARLYANEQFPHAVVRELRRLGHEVITIQERGYAGRKVPDETVLRFAHNESCAILTFNRRDFIRLHKQAEAHSGIIACTIDHDDAALAQRIHKQIEAYKSLSGQLIRIHRPLK